MLSCVEWLGLGEWLILREPAVIPAQAGSTPRLHGSIVGVSGILGHPPARVTTPDVCSHFSRRIAPEPWYWFSLKTLF
jgi:hypothetical protein